MQLEDVVQTKSVLLTPKQTKGSSVAGVLSVLHHDVVGAVRGIRLDASGPGCHNGRFVAIRELTSHDSDCHAAVWLAWLESSAGISVDVEVV